MNLSLIISIRLTKSSLSHTPEKYPVTMYDLAKLDNVEMVYHNTRIKTLVSSPI